MFVLFWLVFLFLLNFSFELFLFWLCLFFCTHVWLLFFLFFRHLSFHQRCPSTSVSNSIESFCVPRSWTANFSRRSKRHRTHGERLLRSFHLINQIFLPKQKKTYFLLQAACIAVAALMQYFLMAAFCWMLVEGIYLYLFVVKVYNINTKMHMYHVISWGISITYLLQHVLEVVPCSHIWCCHQVKCFEFIFLYLWVGFPMIMMAISLGIAAAKEGIQSYVSDK